MGFDIKRLRQGQLIAATGGVVLFIATFFFHWFTSGAFGADGWHSVSITRWLVLVLIIVAIGSAVLAAMQRTIALPVSTSVITATLGALVTVLILYRVISPPGASGFQVDRGIGLFLALVAAAATAFGGYRSLKEEGLVISDLSRSRRSRRR
jgi:hypothetical protein